MLRVGSNKQLSSIINLFIISFIILMPFIAAILFSIAPVWPVEKTIPDSISFKNWSYLFNNSSRFLPSAFISLFLSLSVTLFTATISIPLAEKLARHSFTIKNLINSLLYIPIIIPGYIPFMGIHLTMVKLGITDSLFGVFLAHLPLTIPYMTRALIVSYKTLSMEYETQAKLLGANKINTFFYVVFPHILPAIIAGASLSFLVSISQYLVTLIIGGGNVITLPILMFPFFNGGESAIGSAYALGFIITAFIPLILLDRFMKFYYRKNVI
jgi:putative spermidine/putrescine transport system permease protein